MSNNELDLITVDTSEISTRQMRGNNQLRSEAKHMYFAGIFPTEICEHLNVDPDELYFYIFGRTGKGMEPSCWAYQKLRRPESSAVTYERVKPIVLKSTEAKLMNRVRASIDEMADRGEVFDLDGIDKATKIVERIDKITRLEEGKATQNVQITKKTFTLRDIAAEFETVGEDDEEIEDAVMVRDYDIPSADCTTNDDPGEE